MVGGSKTPSADERNEGHLMCLVEGGIVLHCFALFCINRNLMCSRVALLWVCGAYSMVLLTLGLPRVALQYFHIIMMMSSTDNNFIPAISAPFKFYIASKDSTVH